MNTGTLLEWSTAIPMAQKLRQQQVKLVMTNGCFDLLHVGHVDYLERARALGDRLIVALNSDNSVRQLKGAHRPIQTQADRARILTALRMVDHVIIFDSLRVTELILAIQPAIYVKGGDYTVETLHPEERSALQAVRAQIAILPFVPDRSTSLTLKRMKI